MAVLKAVFLDLFPRDLIVRFGVGTAAHGHFFLIRDDQAIPKSVLVLHLIMVEHRLRASCKRVERLARGPRLDALVAAKNFRPRLLNNEHPDLRRPLGCVGPGRL